MNTATLGRTLLLVGSFVIGMPGLRAAEPLVTNFGLGTILHPIEEPNVISLPQWCRGRPCHKERVHIFGVNGLNPLCLGNFNGLCGYFRQQGFTNTYFGQLYTSHVFAAKIRQIRQADPNARIVLIGFSLGANYVKWVANALARDGVTVDLLVYLVGDTVWNTPSSYPENVRRVVNVRAKGLILTGGDLLFNGDDIAGASNVRVEARHILVPSRKETLELLTRELIMQGCALGGVRPPAQPLPPSGGR
jgi:hypothetical protein